MSMPCIRLPSFLLMKNFRLFLVAIMCQCPVSGFLHFYERRNLDRDIKIECQCPVSGFLHFYIPLILVLLNMTKCVNALYQASFISTLPEFSPISLSRCCVNALYQASFISTLMILTLMIRTQIRVNALYQASFISTLFLQNPLKSRVLTAYFACNCLNILTIMLFA